MMVMDVINLEQQILMPQSYHVHILVPFHLLLEIKTEPQETQEARQHERQRETAIVAKQHSQWQDGLRVMHAIK